MAVIFSGKIMTVIFSGRISKIFCVVVYMNYIKYVGFNNKNASPPPSYSFLIRLIITA